MVAVISLLFIVTVSFFIVRVATIALVRTGMSPVSARFQASSAFTGTGFTTTESEQITRHPVRRRIVISLMLLGNIGIVSVMATLILSVVLEGRSAPWVRIAVILGGLVILGFLATTRFVDHHVGRLVSWALTKWTDLDGRDYSHLLHLAQGYGVTEVVIDTQGPLDQMRVGEGLFLDAHLVLLGVQHPDGVYEGAPTKDLLLEAGDRLFLYGKAQQIAGFCGRRASIPPTGKSAPGGSEAGDSVPGP
ncbi:MAG: TrkA C-terminal domain-containing protein [Polyangiales bacterium]